MKLFKLLGLMLVSFGLFFTSCTDEPIITDPGDGGGNETDPQIILVEQTGYVSSDIEIAPNSEFTVLVDAVSGEVELNTFSVEVDGAALDPSRYTIDGSTPGSSVNLLFGADRTAFTYEITVRAQDDKSFSEYAFVVTDDNNLRASTSIFVNTDVTGGGDVPPDVSVTGNASVEVPGGTLYSVSLSATPVNGQLSSIAVYQDDILISDVSRLEFAGVDFDANPFLFPTEYRDGFTDQSLSIRVQDSGAAIYRVVIADEFGNTTSFEKTITTPATGTPTTSLVGVLLNQAGPSGTGGLDLDTGNSTGSADASAEIRDMGIDGGPLATNWLQQISGVNGSTVRSLVPGQNGLLENFAFENVTTLEAIQDLHNSNGIALNGGVSNTVLVGDYFSVENNGRYYLLVVTNINVTTNDNADSYTFNVKL